MRDYTQEEFNKLKKSAEDTFTIEGNKELKNFTQFLEKLDTDEIEPFKKINKAFLEKEKIKDVLEDYIFDNYPKTEEIFINGFPIYTLDTIIHINLMAVSFCEFHNELELLYQNFHEKNFPQQLSQ
jgi:hypothetical protein